MSLRERSIVNWIIYHLGMDRVYHTMQSMTGALKGQPQTSMISHLVNVFFGYTQLKGRRRAAEGPLWLRASLARQTPVKRQVPKSDEELWWEMRCEQGDIYSWKRVLCCAQVISWSTENESPAIWVIYQANVTNIPWSSCGRLVTQKTHKNFTLDFLFFIWRRTYSPLTSYLLAC